MNTSKLPYELLIRFGPDGKPAGAHVIWQYVASDAGKIVGVTLSQPSPAGADGCDFPIEAGLQIELANAVRDLTAHQATIETLRAERDLARMTAQSLQEKR